MASALLFDTFGSQLIKRIETVFLIEPSQIALTRAKAIIECYCSNASIITVNKKVNDLSEEELKLSDKLYKLHPFSNVLDIDDFDPAFPFIKILKTKGWHSVLAVSHDRNFNGGSKGILELKRRIEEITNDPESRDYCSVSLSQLSRFNCSNRQHAISWQLHLEILDVPC